MSARSIRSRAAVARLVRSAGGGLDERRGEVSVSPIEPVPFDHGAIRSPFAFSQPIHSTSPDGPPGFMTAADDVPMLPFTLVAHDAGANPYRERGQQRRPKKLCRRILHPFALVRRPVVPVARVGAGGASRGRPNRVERQESDKGGSCRDQQESQDRVNHVFRERPPREPWPVERAGFSSLNRSAALPRAAPATLGAVAASENRHVMNSPR